jgi:hypothetical protein
MLKILNLWKVKQLIGYNRIDTVFLENKYTKRVDKQLVSGQDKSNKTLYETLENFIYHAFEKNILKENFIFCT